jgi:hypothetical protein
MSEKYLFSYFQKNGADGLHLAGSHDGLTWTAFRNNLPFLIPEVGRDKLMRDPCIYPGPDGRFHMVWTVSWKEKGIGYAWSDDLIHWSEQRFLPVMEHEETAENCWAPEMIYDRERCEYLIFWATTIPGRFPETDYQSDSGEPDRGNNHRMYVSTTKDFITFSQTRIFYDPGFNVIDLTIVQDGDRYVMFLKDESNRPLPPQKNIKIAFGDQASGPYSNASDPITGDYWTEGPSAIKIGETWHLYMDRYREHVYGLLTSADLVTWEDRTHALTMPEGTRHGTVFRVSDEVFHAVSNA